MDQSGIPDAVKRFILLSVPSVPYLEALLILRAQPDRDWDATQIAAQLYLNPTAAQSVIDLLRQNGVTGYDVRSPGKFHYQPKTPELTRMIDQLTEIYHKNLIEITHLIHDQLNKKAHKFANAFVLGKGK